jgi:uncharacterized protein with NRDE domain
MLMRRFLLVVPKFKADPKFTGDPFYSYNAWDLTNEMQISAPDLETVQAYAGNLFEIQKSGNLAQLQTMEDNFKNETGRYRISPKICEKLRKEYPKVPEIFEIIRLSLN